MKRLFLLLTVFTLLFPRLVTAQDPALEERLNKLDGMIRDLIDAKNAQNKQIEEIALGLRALEDRMNKPNANYVSQDEVKRLTESLKEVDQKRIADNELIIQKVSDLAKLLANPPRPPTPAGGTTSSTPTTPGKYYEHVVQPGDTLSAIAKAYRDQNNIKVTVDDILAANRGLDPRTMQPGRKIIVPAQ
jgi:nucleoid-associated protein YgaU